MPFDVTDEPAVEHAEEIIRSRLGPVDLLVNNAGMWGPINPVWETDPEHWWRAMEVHVRGSFLCARAVLPGMIARQKGRIVNVVSNDMPQGVQMPAAQFRPIPARAME